MTIQILNHFLKKYPDSFTKTKSRFPKLSQYSFHNCIKQISKKTKLDTETLISSINAKNKEYEIMSTKRDQCDTVFNSRFKENVIKYKKKCNGFYLGLSNKNQWVDDIIKNTPKISLKIYPISSSTSTSYSSSTSTSTSTSSSTTTSTSSPPLSINCKKRRKKKGRISPEIRSEVWVHYIEKYYGDQRVQGVKCFCCWKKHITPFTYNNTFQAGHIISEYNGGKITLENLIPICRDCNMNMGTENWDDYVLRNQLPVRTYGNKVPTIVLDSVIYIKYWWNKYKKNKKQKHSVCKSCKKYKLDKTGLVKISKDITRCSYCMNRIRYEQDYCKYCWKNSLKRSKIQFSSSQCVSCGFKK